MTKAKTNMKIEEWDSRRLPEVYEHYEIDFPQQEKKCFDQISKLLEGDNYKLIVAVSPEDGELGGYALVLKLDGYDSLWLDYFAITRKMRGQGFGGEFLKAIDDYYQPNLKGIFAEVEKPNSLDPKERNKQEGRIRFYKRLGAIELDIDYFLPTINGGMDINLFFIPSHGDEIPEMSFVKETVRHVFKTVHNELKCTKELYKKMFNEEL